MRQSSCFLCAGIVGTLNLEDSPNAALQLQFDLSDGVLSCLQKKDNHPHEWHVPIMGMQPLQEVTVSPKLFYFRREKD